jgi:ectoine hydroxylase-related dioxygenase (phytanoyl-CoA dioxygenase family)
MKINNKEFNKKGFIIIKNFFHKKDIDKIINEFANSNLNKSKDTYFEKIKNKKKLRRLERVSDKLLQIKKIIKSKKLGDLLNKLSKKKLTLFKDKLNFKYSGGAGYNPHVDGHYMWIDKNGIKNYGWKKYSNYFLNVVIPIDDVKIKNGCLYVGNKKNIKKLGKNYHQIIKSLSKHNYEIPKKINKKIKYHPIELNSGDILFFDWKCPHFSKKNNSILTRRQIYITYCDSKIPNPRKNYYLDRINTKSDKKKLSLLN